MTATTIVGQRTKNTLDGRDADAARLPDPDRRPPRAAPRRRVRRARRGAQRRRGRAHEEDTCGRRSRRSSPARGSRSSRSSRCARPAGRSRPTRAPSTSATRGTSPTRWASCAHADRGRPDPRHPHPAAAVAPTRCGATLGDEQRTFAQLDAGSNRAAHRLAAEGVVPLDRVVWWGPTVLDALDVCYGVTKLGAALAPINPGFTEGEATTAIEYLRPRVVGRPSDLRGTGARDRHPLGLPVVVTSSDWLDGRGRARALPRGRRQRGSLGDLPHQRVDRCVQGARCSRTAPTWLRAIDARSRRRVAGTQRRSGDVRPLPHGRAGTSSSTRGR